jgi:hypothetical protein
VIRYVVVVIVCHVVPVVVFVCDVLDVSVADDVFAVDIVVDGTAVAFLLLSLLLLVDDVVNVNIFCCFCLLVILLR